MLPAEVTVRDVMQPDPVAVRPDCPVREVMRHLNAHRIGAVLVTAADGRLVGIFTERDLVRRVTVALPGWRDYPVSEWMTPRPFTVEPAVGWEDAVAQMTRLKVRHLPVVEGGRVVGIVSTRVMMEKRTAVLNQRVADRTRELRRVNDELLARDAEVTYNLRAAGRLQNRLLLPDAPPDWPELSWAVHYAPLDHLGGDYYDFALPADPDRLGFLVADASGHSIAAALVAIITRFAFRESALADHRPGPLLTAMNRRLLKVADERFVTAFYAVFDRRANTVRYAAAGHPHPLLVRGDTGDVTPLAGHGFLLGIMPDEVYAEREAAVRPGDRIAFYTDGLVEARNEIGELFGTDRLIGCLRTHGRDDPSAVVRQVLDCLRRFTGDTKLTDDCTLVVVGVNG